MAKRRLRILNALFVALARRWHGARHYERNGELNASAIVGQTAVRLELLPLGKHRTVLKNGYYRPA